VAASSALRIGLARFLDAAKTELETQGKEKVGQLEPSTKSEEA
jgi:hypothetical protein